MKVLRVQLNGRDSKPSTEITTTTQKPSEDRCVLQTWPIPGAPGYGAHGPRLQVTPLGEIQRQRASACAGLVAGEVGTPAKGSWVCFWDDKNFLQLTVVMVVQL